MSEKQLEEPIAVTLLVIDVLEALGVPYFGVPQAIALNCQRGRSGRKEG